MWNWLRILHWRIMYHGIVNIQEDVFTCSFCKKLYLYHVDSIRYRHWNISGFWEEYFLCTTGIGSCYAKFIADYVDPPEDSKDISIYVVSS